MRRSLALGLGLLVSLVMSGTVAAASVTSGFNSSYAVEGSSFGGGSVTYKSGSGVPNYLRADAHGDVVQLIAPYLTTVSIRQGTMTSSRVKYLGLTGRTLNWTMNGSFSRAESNGVGGGVGSQFRHIIEFEVIDATTARAVQVFSYIDMTVSCGLLVYPLGLGGCDNTTSDAFPSRIIGHLSGASVVNGHYYQMLVYSAATITAIGLAFGMDGTTTAQQLSTTFSW